MSEPVFVIEQPDDKGHFPIRWMGEDYIMLGYWDSEIDICGNQVSLTVRFTPMADHLNPKKAPKPTYTSRYGLRRPK